jgi:hypothetical protein
MVYKRFKLEAIAKFLIIFIVTLFSYKVHASYNDVIPPLGK